MTEQKKHLDDQNHELFDLMFHLVNFMGNEDELAKVFIERLPRQHRTLQQNFMRFVQRVVLAYADQAEKYGSDLRNEDSVEWAKAVKVATDKIRAGMRHV